MPFSNLSKVSILYTAFHVEIPALFETKQWSKSSNNFTIRYIMTLVERIYGHRETQTCTQRKNALLERKANPTGIATQVLVELT